MDWALTGLVDSIQVAMAAQVVVDLAVNQDLLNQEIKHVLLTVDYTAAVVVDLKMGTKMVMVQAGLLELSGAQVVLSLVLIRKMYNKH